MKPNKKSETIAKSNSSFTVFHINIRSLGKHQVDLEALLNNIDSPPLILCFSETWLNNDDDKSCFRVNGYQSIFSKLRGTRGGGVMAQCTQETEVLEELPCEIKESLLLQLCVKTNIFLLLVIYNPPRSDKMAFLENLKFFLETLSPEKRVIVCGDINIDVLKNIAASLSYQDTLESNGSEFLIKRAIRVASSSESCLDHFFVRNVNTDEAIIMENQSFSDHFPLQSTVNIKNISKDSSPMRSRDTSFLKSDIKVQQLNTRLEGELPDMNWIHSSVEDNFSSFQKIFESVLAEFPPFKTSKSKNKNTKPRWFDQEIAKAINNRNRLHRA